MIPSDPRGGGDPRRDPRAAVGLPPPPPPPPPPPVLLPPPPMHDLEGQHFPPPATNILFGGEDAMDEDEDVDHNVQRGAMTTLMMDDANIGKVIEPIPILSRIITPSPYPHHVSGATSARFRNALNRVTTHPESDSEAWAALLTEIANCWRELQTSGQVHSPSLETQSKLDFLESCWGALLHQFTGCLPYWLQLGELLLTCSARLGEPGGPLPGSAAAMDLVRANTCEAKLEFLFQTLLGMKTSPEPGPLFGKETAPVAAGAAKTAKDKAAAAGSDEQQPKLDALLEEDATPEEAIFNNPYHIQTLCQQELLGGMGIWAVDVWRLYIRKVLRDIQRRARSRPGDERAKYARGKTVQVYELALRHAAFGHNNHLLWKDYLGYVKSWTSDPDDLSPVLQQQQMIQLRSVYQRLCTYPMTGLDQLWQEYEAFERAQSEDLATALLAEYTPKYQHARNVYLERARVYNYTGDLELGRLATPPVSRKSPSGQAGGGAAGGLEKAGPGGAGGGAGAKAKEDDAAATAEDGEDYADKLEDEYRLLQAWKKRASYERTNPERLHATSTELQQRIRHAYKEMVSVLGRHPEVWHMWSMYEYYHASKAANAIAVLQMGLHHIPDCTLLAYAQAQILEAHALTTMGTATAAGADSPCLKVMERFLDRSPNTLAFCLYQQMVRRYQGIQPARLVFAKARRVLVGEHYKGEGPEQPGEAGADETMAEANDATNVAATAVSATSKDSGKRWMVTNRLDPNIGAPGSAGGGPQSRRRRRNSTDQPQDASQDVYGTTASDFGSLPVTSSPITWHLYASHATIEHRLNKNPEIAARVYELGLRKHENFLTKPPYVLRYAQLLLELQDSVNLRALLTRAVSAVSEDESSSGSSGSKTKLNAIAASLWDMTLQFETLLSGADPNNMSLLQEVERKRHMALMGPDVEDVGTGGYHPDASGTTIGAQKSTIAEQLIRTDGYDISSYIVNGMARSVSVLEVMGLWGSGTTGGVGSGVGSAMSRIARQGTKSGIALLDEADEENELEISGGASDASYQRRLKFQMLHEAGLLQAGGGIDGGGVGGVGGAGNKILSARERLAAAAGAGGAATAGTNAAMNMAIQQQPEWIRPLLLLLPASKMRFAALTRPPPHLTEMALLQLRQSTLPFERPKDDGESGGVQSMRSPTAGQKRRIGGDGGDSSDEENTQGGGGYGMHFRSRQRARQLAYVGGMDGSGEP